MNIYRNWFLASRPWSFTMTAISVSVGSALAAIDGAFSWIYYLIAAAGVAGAFWGAMYWRFKNLAPVIISHSIWSTVIFAFLPMR